MLHVSCCTFVLLQVFPSFPRIRGLTWEETERFTEEARKRRSELLDVKFPGPFFAGTCAEKPICWVPTLVRGSEILSQKVGRLQKIGH